MSDREILGRAFLNRTIKIKRPDDMPLFGKIVRERKGAYVCMITFVESRRHYHDEMVYADNVVQVKRHMQKIYPTIIFKLPPRVKAKRNSRSKRK